MPLQSEMHESIILTSCNRAYADLTSPHPTLTGIASFNLRTLCPNFGKLILGARG